jgi:hypothetical protein
MELGNEVQGNSEEQKGLVAFHQLKTLAKGSVIKGVHQGRFESKKTPGYFFHVFKDVNGDASGYGTCQAFDDRVKEIKDKEIAIGRKIYAELTFNGRIPSKKNPKMTYYNFSAAKMTEVLGDEGKLDAPTSQPQGTPDHTASDIPF